MDYYIFFPENGKPKKLMVPPNSKHQLNHLIGPKSPSYELLPIHEFDKNQEDGSRLVYLFAYVNLPSKETIETAISELNLNPVVKDDEDE
ncbi:hypothetical protein [Citrobacter europaeus]|uniref:hypothetical protein n=1 Tax=Citrobacter europaeus TaxID=1914243 RepID=UPI001BCFBB92|nr:hypothetical protein [Citrobacter europaeus]